MKKPIVRRNRTLKGSPKLPPPLPHSHPHTPPKSLITKFFKSVMSCRVCLFVFVFGRVADSSESKSRLRLFFCGCRQCADQVIYFIIKSWPEFTGECQSCFIVKSWPEYTGECQSYFIIKSWPEFTGECQSCFIIKSWPELTVTFRTETLSRAWIHLFGCWNCRIIMQKPSQPLTCFCLHLGT